MYVTHGEDNTSYKDGYRLTLGGTLETGLPNTFYVVFGDKVIKTK
jgi:hypothetical protein